jgi:hypothetical protein
MSDTKIINISGSAAADLSGSKRRRTYKKKQDGGDINAVKGIESTSSIALTAASPNSQTWLKPITNPVPPQIYPVPSRIPIVAPVVAPVPVSIPVPKVATVQQGGTTKHIRVELKKKIDTKKVHLNPKKPEKHVSKKHQTKKSRKITLGVVSLHKRITHAKKLHKKVKEMPIEVLKEKLVKAGLIKSTSKAPESVLRQIAADAAVVKNKAL